MSSNNLAQYKVVMCKQCQFAVVPNQVRGHLSTFNHVIRQIVQGYDESWNDCLSTEFQKSNLPNYYVSYPERTIDFYKLAPSA